MNRTKEIIDQISNIGNRHRFGHGMAELTIRLYEIESSFNKFDKKNDELIRYFPIALVACMEGYFRLMIKDIVDSGEPYLSNAEKPAALIKLDFSVLRAVHGKNITVGELIAHSVSISKRSVGW